MSSNIVVCLNRYESDKDEEIELIRKICLDQEVEFAISTSYKDGGEGSIDLAKKVLKVMECENKINYLYSLTDDIKTKIASLSKNIYRAKNVEYSDLAEEKIKQLQENNISNLPICVAKTQYSLSDDKTKLGLPTDYTLHVKDIKVYNGAGYITVLLGKILTMPGLPPTPNYEKIDIDDDNNIIGLS